MKVQTKFFIFLGTLFVTGPMLVPLVVAGSPPSAGRTIADSQPVSLSAAYRAALEKTVPAQIQRARLGQQDEKMKQAKGALLPSIVFSASYFRQQSVSAPAGTSSSTSSQLDPNQIVSKVGLTQPIFKGFKEYAAIHQTRLQQTAQERTLAFTEQSLYANVAQAYFSVLAAEQDLRNLGTLSGLMEKRIVELRQKSSIGRSRKGELLAAQTQLSTLNGQQEAAKLGVNQARDSFAFFTGLERDTKFAESNVQVPSTIEPLQQYLAKIESRPDLQALRIQVESAEESVKIARGGHFPNIDAGANYYLKRQGTLEPVHWDVGVTFTLPLFQGGVVQSQVAEAGLKVKESDLILAQSRQDVEKQVKSYHEAFLQGLSQIQSYEDALRISEENYEVQSKDYRLGLVTNLDVIQSLNTFQETKRVLDRLRIQTKVNHLLLETAVGKISPD